METKIMNRLNGYDRHFKGRFLLLHRKLLSDSEYVLWDLGFSALADWDDKNHPGDYGSFSYPFKEIGYLLGWHESKVGRKAKKLFALGFWVKKERRIFVSGFEIRNRLAQIVEKEKVVDLQHQLANLQLGNAKPQESDVNLQEESSKGNGHISAQDHAILQEPFPKAPLSSFKCGCNYRNGHRSDEEYQRLSEDPSNSDIGEMKLYDETLWETMGVCPHGEKRYANTNR